MKLIPSGRRQKMGHQHEPPAKRLGWEALPGPDGGGRNRRVQPLFTWLLALGPASELPPSFSPAFSSPPLQTLPLHPHSAIVPPPDLFHLSSPTGPQLPLSLSLHSSSLHLPSHSPPGSLYFLTSISKPPILPIPHRLIPGSPSDPLLSDSARPGWGRGQGWDRAPQLPLLTFFV